MITRPLIPGDALEITLTFTLPYNAPLENWELDLVCEGFFWFSSRGIQSCPILTLPPPKLDQLKVESPGVNKYVLIWATHSWLVSVRRCMYCTL